jgi:hypothetical protein
MGPDGEKNFGMENGMSLEPDVDRYAVTMDTRRLR